MCVNYISDLRKLESELGRATETCKMLLRETDLKSMKDVPVLGQED